MTPKELLTKIAKGKFDPIYYFYGSEDYRMVEAQKYLVHQFLPDRQITTNYTKVDGRKTKCADLLAELSVYPMLGERQVISVNDIQSYKPKELEKILAILNPPDPNRVVLLKSPSARQPKKNVASFKKLCVAATAIEFKKLGPSETAGIIRARLKKGNLQIDSKALTLLTTMTSGNLGAVDVECRKLIDFMDAGATISEENVRSISAGFETYSVFSLAEEIVRGDAKRCLNQVHKLLTIGSSADQIMYHIEAHFLHLFLAKNNKPLPARVRWITGKFSEQARKFSSDQLETALILAAETTASLRRSGIKPETAVELLVVRLLDPSSLDA